MPDCGHRIRDIGVIFHPLLVGCLDLIKLFVTTGSSTLPRAQTRATDTENRTDKVTAATSSTSLYDNVGSTQTGSASGRKLAIL